MKVTTNLLNSTNIYKNLEQYNGFGGVESIRILGKNYLDFDKKYPVFGGGQLKWYKYPESNVSTVCYLSRDR